MRTRTGTGAALAIALGAATGCNYAFRNPAETLAAGQVSGRTLAGASVVVDGASVSVKNAGLSGVSRQNGAFTLLPLPVGRHTLLFRKGTERALQREVEIALGKDGQPEGVWLGDVIVPAAVSLSGTVRLPAVAGLPASLGPGGVALDQESGTTAPIGPDGSYAMQGLAVGEHRLRFYATDGGGREFVGGPIAVALGPADAGTRKVLSRVEMHPVVPVATLAATVTFKVAVAGDVPGLTLPSLRLSGLPAPAEVDGNGQVQVRLREGLWTVGVALPANVSAASPPPTVTFAAVAGEVIDLGTLLVVSDAAQARAAHACRADADCAPADTCLASGVCGPQWQPPPGAPASVPICAGATRGCVVGQPIASSGPFVTTTCVGSGQAGFPLACGACCTPEGVQTFCAVPGLGGCPALLPSGGAAGRTVSGTLTGAGSAGTLVVLTDEISLVRQATAGDGGAFSFTGVPDGTYLVAPSSTTALFAPPSRSVTVAGADVAGVDFGGSAVATFTVSGSVVEAGAAVPGVTVTLTTLGTGAIQTATTDGAGAFRFTGVLGAAFTLTPSAPQLVFNPPSVTFAGSDLATTFTASQRPAGSHRLSGRVSYNGSTASPVPLGARIALLGPGADTLVDLAVDGTWFLDGLADGVFDVTPQHAAFAFAPGTRQVTLAGADIGGVDFDMHLPRLSGHVTLAGTAPLAGVAVQLRDASASLLATATTDAAGLYDLGGLPIATYSVTPALPGYTFNPPSVQQLLLSADTAVDFAASVQTAFTIAGHVRGAGAANPGLTLELTGAGLAAPLQAPLDALGDYAFTALAPGIYTVTPLGTSVTWEPASSTFGVGPDALGVDFSAWPRACVDCSITWSWPRPQGNQLHALWGSSAGDVWAVGDLGSTLHYDGVSWTPSLNPTNRSLRAVWGSGSTDVWAVGDGGTISHFNGAFWSGVISPTTADLTGVWGSASNDVWAAGNGVILHNTNGSWVTSWTGTARLAAIWGAAASAIWAAGTDPSSGQGVFLRYSAAAGWQTVQTVAEPIQALWGTSATDGWAAGSAGGIYQLAGSTWSLGPAGAEAANLVAGWSSGQSESWTAGGPSVQRFQGTSWSMAHPPGSFNVRALWGTAPTNLWAVGEGGAIFHWDGTSWSAFNGASATTTSLAAAWAASATAAWAVGENTLLRWDGTTWTPSTPPTAMALTGIWGSSPSDVWMVGMSGDVAYHFTGSTWTPFSLPNASTNALRAIGGSGPTDVWAVGDAGTILHYGGSSWTGSVTSPATGSLTGVWADSPSEAWAVGPLDLLHWSGAGWTATAVPSGFTPAAVWGTSARNVWCVGHLTGTATGAIAQWSGQGWTLLPDLVAAPLRGIAGTAPDEILAVGDGGLVMVHGGSVWSRYAFASIADLRAVAAGGPSAVFLVGLDDTILKYGF